MANNFFAAIELIGGGIGALDAIDGTNLSDGDAATVQIDGIVYFYHLNLLGAAESSPNVIEPDTNAGSKRWVLQTVKVGKLGGDYIRCHDEKAAGVASGTFTAGAWQTRDIAEDQDVGEHCSVAANVITLAAGTYDCLIRCAAFRVDVHKTRLRNTTDGSNIIIGSGSRADAAALDQNESWIQGRFILAAAKDIEIQHRSTATKATNGFGVVLGLEVEVYAVAEFWKIT